MKPDPFRYFRVEARDLLQQLGRGVLDMEKGAAPAQLVQELLRHAHTLKGAARVVKQSAIAEGAHAVEDALAPFRVGGVAAKRNDIDAILEHLDRMTALVTQLGSSPAASSAATLPEPQGSPEISASVGELDALIDSITEAMIQIGSLRRALCAEDDETGSVETTRSAHGSGMAGAGVVMPSTATSRVDDAHALERTRTWDLRSSLDQIEREVCQARDAAVSLRLVPANSIFGALERIARDTARAVGKNVVFEPRGGELRVEAPVLKSVQDALVQVVRNAIAHGIEHELDRRAAGKPPAGLVSLEITSRGDHIAFTCKDDGRGLDLASLRSAAEAKGLIDPSTTEVLAEQLIQILLRGGVSTSKSVTEVAGRGVGLDVVREAVARVGGEVAVSTEPARGTTIEIIVPLTLSALDALTVHAGDMVLALPLASVRRTIRIAPDQIVRGSSGASIVVDGMVTAFAPLSSCLGEGPDADQAAQAWTTVIVTDGVKMAALGVDRIIGTSRLVARSMPRVAPVHAIVAGCFLDVEGNPRLVLDPKHVVVAASQARSAATAEKPVKRAPILVVDDSLTTRMLEQSILESAGYEVVLAVSGEDGFDKACRNRFGLILVDVEMPGMDGFAFVQRVRAHPDLRTIPTILVTSRDSQADRRRGLEVGASGHISKGAFDQSDLLDRIKGLIG